MRPQARPPYVSPTLQPIDDCLPKVIRPVGNRIVSESAFALFQQKRAIRIVNSNIVEIFKGHARVTRAT